MRTHDLINEVASGSITPGQAVDAMLETFSLVKTRHGAVPDALLNKVVTAAQSGGKTWDKTKTQLRKAQSKLEKKGHSMHNELKPKYERYAGTPLGADIRKIHRGVADSAAFMLARH